MHPVFVVAAICFVDPADQLLTVRKRGTTSFMLPGGKIEDGESPEQAAIREVREEIGVTVDPAAMILLGVCETAAANEPSARIHATVFRAELSGEPEAAAEIAELRWTPVDTDQRDDLAPMLREFVLPALLREPRVELVEDR